MRPAVMIILAVLIGALWAFDTYEYEAVIVQPLAKIPNTWLIRSSTRQRTCWEAAATGDDNELRS